MSLPAIITARRRSASLAAVEGFKISYVQNRDPQHAFAAGLEYVKILGALLGGACRA
jgi:hypothetical protein